MMRNRSWLAGLASKIFPRRFAAAKRAARRRPRAPLRSFSDAPLATETLEPRHLLSGVSLVSVDVLAQGNEADGSPTDMDELTITVNVTNVAPTGVVLVNEVASLAEDADTSGKLADIVIDDDGEGSNTISLTGTDAASFEVVGTELFLAAGTMLDYEAKTSYAVTVNVEDSGVSGSTPVTVDYVLDITDVPATVSIAVTQMGNEADSSATIFTLTRAGDVSGSLSVNLLLLGSAKADSDYTAPAGLGVDKTLAVSFLAGSDTATLSMATLSDSVIDSMESILAVLQPGAGYSIAPGGDRANGYVGAEGIAVELDMLDSAYSSNGNRVDKRFNPGTSQAANLGAFAALNTDGTIASWGEMHWDYVKTDPPTDGGFTQVVPNAYAFAGLKEDGSIVCWGRRGRGGGGDASEIDAPSDNGYVSIYSNEAAFAALKSDGSLTIWGHAGHAAGEVPTNNQDFVQVVSNALDFTAIRADGSLWSSLGGAPGDTGYVAVTANKDAFTALKSDGSLVVWGDSRRFDSIPSDTGHARLYSNPFASASLKSDGSIASWGYSGYGGDGTAPAGNNFVSVTPGYYAFAGLKDDGSVASWGDATFGGTGAPVDTDYVQVVSNEGAFAALNADGTVAVWGSDSFGGLNAPAGSSFVQLFAGGRAFAAMTADGSITVWGDSAYGGSGAPVESGFIDIIPNQYAFAAVTADGSITVWGASGYGASGAPAETGFLSFAKPEPLSTFTVGNKAPTVVALANTVTSLDENADTSSRVKVADIAITDDGVGTNTISLTGTDATSFTVVGTELFLAAGTSLDYESQTSYDVTVSVEDGSVAGSTPVTVNYTLAISDVNETPLIQSHGFSVAENAAAGVVLGTLVGSDPENDSLTFSITGNVDPDGDSVDAFRIEGNQLVVNDAGGFDSAGSPQLVLTVEVSDGNLTDSAQVTVDVDAAHVISLDNASVGENENVGAVVGSLLFDGSASGPQFEMVDEAMSWQAAKTRAESMGGHLATFASEEEWNQMVAQIGSTTEHLWIGLTDEASEGTWQWITGEPFVYHRWGPGEPNGTFYSEDYAHLYDLTDPVQGYWNDDPGHYNKRLLVETVGTVVQFALVAGDGDTDNHRFDVVDGELVTSESFDYESNQSFSIRVRATDGDEAYEQILAIAVTDVNEAPTGVAFANTVSSLPEDTDTTSAVKVADIQVTDDALGSNAISLSGTDAASFAVVGTELFLAAGTSLDYESQTSYDVTVSVEDSSVSGSTPVTVNYTLAISDVNEAPTGVTLANATASLPEDTDTASRIKVADILITDDALGTNVISLTGTDAASFEVDGTELFLAAGTVLDYESQASFDVTVSVEDSSVVGSTPVTVDYSLLITDIDETPVIFVVDTTNDTVDANPGDGVAVDASGQTSLRAAVMEANALSNNAEITLPAGTYTLTIAGAGEGDSTTGDLDITSNTTIIGDGAATTIINGNSLDRVIDISADVVLRDLTVTGGRAPGPGQLGNGYGGGIHIGGDRVVLLERVAISNNHGAFGTGGISNGGGQLTVMDSTVSGNSTNYAGGGIWVWSGGTANIINTTISGNSADNGGGVEARYDGSSVTVINSTIAGNSSVYGGGGVRSESGGTVILKNTIVAYNSSGSGPDILNYLGSGTIISQGNNLVGNTSGFSGLIGSDLGNVDPLLGPLQDNGGSTPTRALSAGSPAIDAGDATGAPLFDQRGESRPYDGDGDGAAIIDIGAYEYSSSNAAPTGVVLANTVSSLPEDTDTSSAVKLADIQITDDALGTNVISLSGADAASFTVVGAELFLAAGTSLDYETQTSLDVTVSVQDSSVADSPPVTVNYMLSIADVNEPPEQLTLSNTVSSIVDNVDTSASIKLADVSFADDALGQNTISLTGADAASFEVIGSELFLKAGTALDYKTKPVFDVTLQVRDSTAGPPGSFVSDWTHQYGSANTDWVRGVGADVSGNVYAFGETRETAFNGVDPVGSTDFYISKFDSTGAEQWTIVEGSTAPDSVTGRMVVDSSGNCYVAGETLGSLFDSKGAGAADGWLGKYDTEGNLVWGRQFSSDGWDTSKNITLDSSGNLYLLGYTTGSLDAANAGNADVFVRKYDSSGNLLWANQFGSDRADRGYDLVVNALGESYIVGSTYGNLSGEDNPGAPNKSGGFLAKLSAEGNLLWTEIIASDANDQLYGVALDSLGSVVLVGETLGNINGQAGLGAQDLIVAKYNANGDEGWTRYLSGSGADHGYGVAIDAADDIIVSGKTTSSDGDLDSTTSYGNYDAILARFDADGGLLRIDRFGGPDSDLLSPLHLSEDGTLLAGGNTRGAWFAPNAYGTDGVHYDSVLMQFQESLPESSTIDYRLSVLPVEVLIDTLQSGSETDGTPTVFTLARTGDTSNPLNVNLILQGTAQADVDYTAPAGLGENNTLIVTFAAGSDTATVSLPTLADSVVDSYENVLAILQSGSGYNITPGADRAEAILAADGLVAAVDNSKSIGRYNVFHSLSNGYFAALDASGVISVWGPDSAHDLVTQRPTIPGFVEIVSNNYAFSAIHADGSAHSWGSATQGGSHIATFSSGHPPDYGGVLRDVSDLLTDDVVRVVPAAESFTAIKSDGTSVFWGHYGNYYINTLVDHPENVTQVATTWGWAVAALSADGSITAWGQGMDGGGSSIMPRYLQPTGTGYTALAANHWAFAALHEDTSISCWGGGPWDWPYMASVDDAPTDAGYVSVVGNESQIQSAFAAMKANGSISSWGGVVQEPYGSGFTRIIAAETAFTAINRDGSLYSWGGAGDAPAGNDFTQVFNTTDAFAAIRQDGTVAAWGDWDYGGYTASVDHLLHDVVTIVGNRQAFAALKADGTVVTWGAASHGGDSSAVADQLTGVTAIMKIDDAFTARRSDGSLVSWGNSGNILPPPTTGLYPGFVNIDTVDQLTFDSFLSITPNPISEAAGAAAATGTVTRTGDLVGDLVVSLASSDKSEAVVPDSVTIPDGQASASFPINAVNDDEGDLVQPVYITAWAAGEHYGRALLKVADDGDGVLFIDDGDAIGFGFATVNDQGYQGDYQWTLGVSPSSPGYMQYEVTNIAPGDYEIATTWQTETEIASIDRHSAVKYEIYDGPTLLDTVVVNQQQAPAADYTAGGENFEIIVPTVSIASDTLTVRILVQSLAVGGLRTISFDAVRIDSLDFIDPGDPLSLSLSTADASITEGGAGTLATLSRTGLLDQTLAISILNSHPAEAVTPDYVVIPAGESQVTFAVDAVDDHFDDGNQTITLSANARGEVAAASLQVIDDDDNVVPSFDDQTISVAENSAEGTIVGTLVAADDNDDVLTFVITNNVDIDEDGNDAFRIEGDQLIVNDPDDLDHETNPQLVITAEASDGSLSDTAEITVNVTDVPDTPGSISGTFWHDFDEDGERDTDEPFLSGWTAYLDTDENGQLDAGEITTTTNANGEYTFTALDPGTYVVGQVLQAGWRQTYPNYASSTAAAMRTVAARNTDALMGSHDGPSNDATYVVAAQISSLEGMDDYEIDNAGNVIFYDPLPTSPPPTEQPSDPVQSPTYALSETFQLHSRPGASKVIYLDFDGHTTTGTWWNVSFGEPIVSLAYSYEGDASFSDAELQTIQNVWEWVAEDFIPFDVDVTTEDPGTAALSKSGGADTEWGIRVVVGPNTWYSDAGGVAYVGSFNWENDTPCFVFNTSEQGVAEAASHEVGHALGLYHDGTSTEGYYTGHGSGATGWAPIMGVGYYQQLVQWSKGEYSDANNTEDDLAIITTSNGFDYRPDDHGDALVDATVLAIDNGTQVAGEGIIERNTDVDAFAFTTGSGNVQLSIDPFYRSPDLDILATLYSEAGEVLATSNPAELLGADFDLELDYGTYFISIDGAGKGDLVSGYSDYGSLGQYTVSGTVVPSVLSGSHVVELDFAEDITDIDFGSRADNVPPNFDDQTMSVAENSAEGTVVGTLAATDADGDPLTYSIASNVDTDGDGNAAFRIEGDQLLMNDPDEFDYEANSQLVITAEASDGSLTDTAQVTVNLTDVNEAPTDVALTGTVTSLAEDTDTSSAVKVADIVITDDGLGTNAISLTGADATSFEVVGTELFLVAGTALDYETKISYSVTVSVEDNCYNSISGFPELAGWYVHTTSVGNIPFDDPNHGRVRVIQDTDCYYHIEIEDAGDFDYDTTLILDRLGNGDISLVYKFNPGDGTVFFHTIYGTLADGTPFEEYVGNGGTHSFMIPGGNDAAYCECAGSVPVTVNYSLAISDVNEAPTGVALANTVTSLPEDTDTSGAIKVADIQVTDDALGTNVISLTGTDASSFTVVDTELFLAAGTVLDYETKSSYDVTVSVADSSVAGSTPLTVDYSLLIDDVAGIVSIATTQQGSKTNGPSNRNLGFNRFSGLDQEGDGGGGSDGTDGGDDGEGDEDDGGGGEDPGSATLQPTIFTLTRTGDTSSPLDVSLILQGTAQPDWDYDAPAGLGVNNTLTVSFAAGSDTVTVSLPTEPDWELVDSYQSVVAILRQGLGYTIMPGSDRTVAYLTADGVDVADDRHAPFDGPNSTHRLLRNGNFAVLDANGSISVGGPDSDSDSSLRQDVPEAAGYQQLYSNANAFCALHSDGSVSAWGHSSFGGSLGSVAGSLTEGVVSIVPSRSSFTAFKADGSVVMWGNPTGGQFANYVYPPNEIFGVKKVATTYAATAVLTAGGDIYAWGNPVEGGGAAGDGHRHNSPADSGYTDIVGGWATFAALRADGSIRTWGGGPEQPWWGDPEIGSVTKTPTDAGYTHIVANGATATSFAAMKADGSITTWGMINHNPPGSGFTQIVPSENAFTAIRTDGSLYSWNADGALADTPTVSDITQVVANANAFAAIREDGSVVTWGDSASGGDSDSVSEELFDVVKIASTDLGFAALRRDGSVVPWGDQYHGGSWGVVGGNITDIFANDIFATDNAFAARSGNGSLAIWGYDTATYSESDAYGFVAHVDPLLNDRLILDSFFDSGPFLIDDGDPGYSSNLSPVTITGQGYEGDYRWIVGTTPDSPYHIQYVKTSVAAGDYQIATTWQTQSEISSFQRHEAVKYEIYDGLTLVDTVTVNQRLAPAADYTESGENFQLIASGVSIDSGSLNVKILVQSPGEGYSNYRTISADAVLVMADYGDPPVMEDQTFSVAENSSEGTVIGTLAATDADGDAITYSIISNVDPDADGSDAVRVEGDQLLVNDADDLDYETNPQLVITAKASDGNGFNTAMITVNLIDVEEIPVITILGDSPYTVQPSNTTSYSDPGATASDDEDGDLTGSILVSGDVVDLGVPGSYLIEYNVVDSAGNDAETVTRTVLVQDTLPPVITLTGEAIVNVTFDPSGTYSDPGATAVDSLDGDLTGSVVVGGDVVDLSQPGSYTLTYNVSDNAGNAAEQVTRTVHVVACDYGDAPATYPVTLAEDGARHGVAGGNVEWETLGQGISVETESFGLPVAISGGGNTLAVGNVTTGTQVYRWDGSAWIQLGSNVAGAPAGSNIFYSVSLSDDGNTVAVGDPYQAGSVRIYSWDGSAWNQLGSNIEGEGVDYRLGGSVSLSSDGQTVAIGGDLGLVRIYHLDGAEWYKRGDDINVQVNYYYASVAVSLSGDGNAVAIGSPESGTAGVSQIYQWNGTAWNQLGTDIDGEASGDQSGGSVSLSSDGHTVAIGAHYNDGDSGQWSSRGHTRIFTWDGIDWVQRGSDIDGDDTWGYSGSSVALSDDGETVAIGAFWGDGGGARIYRWLDNQWQQAGDQLQTGDYGGDGYHGSIALSADGSRVVVGPFSSDLVRVFDAQVEPLRLGSSIDDEPDGVHSPGADADGADEDGVVFGNLIAGDTASVDVTVSGASGFLDAWLDLNADGDWSDAEEQIFVSQAVSVGVNNLSFAVPVDATIGTTFARFRLSSTGGLDVTGLAADGEVEDYAVIISVPVDQSPVITLVGNSPDVVEASSTGDYSDPGATAMDPEDGDISGSVEVSGQVVNLSVPGSYVIEYDVADSAGNDAETVTRTVIVQDTLAPVISLIGDAVVNVTVDPSGTYSDAGATAVDSLDGDLTASIVASGDVVDLAQAGTYTLTYNVSDNAGNDAEQVTRTVNVLPVVVGEVTILDDGEAGFAQTGFTEQSNAQVAAAYDSDVHHMQGGSGEASWTFTGLPADRYQVAATWAYKYNNNYNATDAPFTLSDGAGGVFSTQIVNQKNTPSEFEDAGYSWDTLDTVEVSGGTLVVTLGAGSLSNKWVVADAIRVSVAPTLTVTIADASVAESAGAAATTAIVTRNGSLDADLVVSLASNDLTEASVPASVTIPAGQASATFSIDAVDDVFFDGSQAVNVLATAIGYSDGSDLLEILDDETAHTALIDDGEPGFTQSGFSYQSNAQVAAAYNGDNYNLRNGDDADQASWTFTGLDDGAYRVMATWAHKYNNNYNATDAPFQILDAGSNVLSSVAINQKNAPSQHEAGGFFWDTLDTVYVAGGELKVTLGASAQANKFVVADAVRIEQIVQATPTLVVQLGEEIVDEDASSVSGIVSRGAETVGDLVVTLNSDATAVSTVPATVTIPDGAGAVPFTLTVVDDAIVDGDQQVTVTATAAGYTGGSDSLLVEDDEFPPVQIIDNGDAGFTETGGFTDRTWAEAYGGDNHYMRGSDGEARWQFTDLIDGEYTVSITWDHISDNRYNATDAPFTIRNAADEQLLAAAVDQTLSPADFSDGVTDWHTLGTVYVIDGELTVSLTEALVNKYVVADAVRIEIDTNPTSKLLVILDASSVSEAGTVNGKVIRTGEPAGSLTVNLASDNNDAATVPASVVIADGERYGTFAITPTDDSAPDGTQVANISATANGFTAGTAAVDVLDDDATILFVDNGEDGFVADAGFKRRNVAGAYQNDNHSMRGGTGEASWTFTGLEEGQYFVSATWNHIYENRYNTEKAPFSITNGSGNLLSTLTVDQTQTPDDFTDGGYGWEALAPVYINDGTLIVTLGASPTNHHAVADAIRIELNESLAPSLFVLVDSESESAGSATGTVVRTGDTSSEASVSLTSSNHAAATVETSITFAIGESTKSFVITPTDDSSPDGIQQSTVEATATGYAAGSAVLNVEDDDALEVAIMDNTDNGYTSNGFRYNANKQVSDAYGGNNESLKGGEPGEAASWTFTGLTDGVYHVSATWNHQYNNNYNAHDAQYSITNAGDEALATTTINQSNAPSEFLDNGIAWGTLDTVTVTGGELVVTVSGGSNPNRHTVADAVRIARVAQLGGSSMRMAEVDPFYDPLEDSLDDLASEWSGASEEEDQLVWGE